MSASLVGSEMCIRDRGRRKPLKAAEQNAENCIMCCCPSAVVHVAEPNNCLLYTSDAADDM
eukprot:12047488-Alexandrium_andersonii.AAC.1